MPKLRTLSQAGKVIERYGFCLLFPFKGVKLPSLVGAIKGRPLRHYDPRTDCSDDFLRAWKWKDELPRKRLAYYGKYFRGRGTFLSLEFLSCFFCLEGNPGAGDGFERLYRAGELSPEARAVCKEIAKNGPLGTLELRYALGWEAKRANHRFKRAVLELQKRLLITHWGVAAETRAWESNVYQLTARAFPKAVRAAAKLSPEKARCRIASCYRKQYPKVTPPEIARLFRWTCARAEDALGG